MYKGQIPFDEEGNLLHYPIDRIDWRDNKQFLAELKLIGMERGMSAAYFIMQDQNTKQKYTIFMKDFFELFENVHIFDRFEFCKRGRNYGIKKVSHS